MRITKNNVFGICITLQMPMINSTTASKSAQKFETNFNQWEESKCHASIPE
jgi:hypothetical protein